MPSALKKVGDPVQLPSGVRVRIMAPADRARPWRLTPSGSFWMLTRAGRSGRPDYYFADGRPLQLDHVDAEALLAILAGVMA